MRNSKLIKLICLLISLFMVVSLLGACNSKDGDTVTSSEGGSQTPAEDSEPDDSDSQDTIDDGEDPNYDEPYDDNYYGDPNGYDDSDNWGNNNDGSDNYDGGDNNTPPDDEDDELDNYAASIKILNSEKPLTSQYRGVSGSIYHAFGHMLDDKTGRAYTDEMMDLELSRLQDAGVRFARTRYYTGWAWDGSGWDWNSKRMNYYWQYCKDLQERGINVVQSVGWHLGVITEMRSASIGEVPYIQSGQNYEDLYGESDGYDFSKCLNDNYKMYAKKSLRLAYFQAETLKQAKARGIHNITHLLYFTEPSYTDNTLVNPNKPGQKHGEEGLEADEYIFIVQTIQQKLKDEGVYNMVQHIGPNQGSKSHGDGLLRYMLEKGCKDMFDVWTCHFYPKSSDITNNVFYDITDPVFESYVQPLKDVGIFGKVEFWVDEFYSNQGGLGGDQAWVGLQNVVGFIAAQQRGINNFSLWQIFDQLWTDQNNTGGEFVNGIHVCGSAPSLFVSSIPRRQYYSTSLFAKYNGYQNGKSYRTNNDDLQMYTDLHVGAAQLEDGSWTITVVNAGIDDYDITVEFDKAIYQTLYRHVNNENTNIGTTAARLPDADKTFANVKNKFKDTIKGGCVAIYTGVKG
ncbi:MAG: hypothetical protein U0L55_01760 [Acutalibacteraceae bacterium]|nr:hypothetical protein [Acutalibacteraceae bacterium]